MTYSRQQERKADSVGLRLFLNTLYDPFESISCLNILDTIDKYKYQDNIDFDEVLGFEKYPFKQRWLEPGTIIFDAHSESDNQLNDSLKSHPDRKERVALLQSILSGIKNKHPKFVSQDSIFFSYLSEQLDYEFIESWIFYNDYGKAFFFTLKKLENEPKNQELLLKMSNIMRLIYNSREEHNYSNYVEKPNLENEKEYNNILYFLDNIRLVELANIAYYFHESHIEQVNRNSVFKENFNYFKSKSY